MTKGSFNELEILGQEDLIVESLRKLLKAYAELGRREEETKDLLKSLCSFSLEAWVWFILLEGGGAQRFTDILHIVGCARSKLSDVLRELLKAGLVRMVDKKYQAIYPGWLVRFSVPNRLKAGE